MDKKLNEFRKANEEILGKSQDDFEKQLSFISAGALGLSMFLIEKVVKDLSNANNKWILISSWSLLGTTLIINLISHFIAVNFNYKNIEEIQAKQYDNIKVSGRNKTIKRINLFTLITLVLGIICLILFISLNL